MFFMWLHIAFVLFMQNQKYIEPDFIIFYISSCSYFSTDSNNSDSSQSEQQFEDQR